MRLANFFIRPFKYLLNRRFDGLHYHDRIGILAVTPIADLQSSFFHIPLDVFLGIAVDQVIHFFMNKLCGFKLFGE